MEKRKLNFLFLQNTDCRISFLSGSTLPEGSISVRDTVSCKPSKYGRLLWIMEEKEGGPGGGREDDDETARLMQRGHETNPSSRLRCEGLEGGGLRLLTPRLDHHTLHSGYSD